jgi:hypothetical protein
LCRTHLVQKILSFREKRAGSMPRHQNRLRKQLANSITSGTEGKTTPTQRAPHRKILAREPVTLDGITAVMELYAFHKDDIEKILTTRKRNPGAYEVLFSEFRHKYTNYEALLKILPRDPLQKSIKDFIHRELRRLGHKTGPGW